MVQSTSRDAAMMELHVCNRRGAVLRAYALGDSTDELIVGREEHCDIRISARSVSREHCAIERDDDGLSIRDLGSTGGTIIGGERVQKIRLQSGMEIAVGPAVLRFVETAV
jgi:pSer/pThr/pTyr-binding forkhead associated (FHA) protein